MLKNVLSKVWTNLSRPIWVGNDLESSMARLPSKDYIIRSVAISGTGSCCYGTDGVRTKKIGGYGHVIGILTILCKTCISKTYLFILIDQVIVALVMQLHTVDFDLHYAITSIIMTIRKRIRAYVLMVIVNNISTLPNSMKNVLVRLHC